MPGSSVPTDSRSRSTRTYSATVAGLLEQCDRGRLDEESVRIMTSALAWRGLKVNPNLHAVLAEHAQERWNETGDEPWNAPGLAVEKDALGDVAVTVRPNVWLALQGVAAVTVIALGLVSYRTRPYTLATIEGGLVAAVAVVATNRAVIKWLPERTPRGRLFGAMLAVFAIGLTLAPLVVSRAL